MGRKTVEWAAPRGRMHRAFNGLYGNRMIQFGNKVSFAENKSRRTWKPNVQVSSVYSEALGRKLRFRMTTYVMRCIKKHGGIDEYLLKTKDSEIKYPKAIEYKHQIRALRKARAKETEAAPSASADSSEPQEGMTLGGPVHPSQNVSMRAPSLADALCVAPGPGVAVRGER